MAYLTVQNLRDEGVPLTIADATVQAAINTWSAFIDRACMQWFEPRTHTLEIDGNDSDCLFMPVPIISVTSLYVNDDFTNALPTTEYEVYNKRGGTDGSDDRRNPKIRLIPQTAFWVPINVMASGRGKNFFRGRKNQKIVGSFGFTESDNSVPLLIIRALKKLIIRDLASQGAGGMWQSVTMTPSTPAGPVVSETTDGHSITYDAGSTAPGRQGFTSMVGDPEIDKIITLYRAPIALAVPGSDYWFRG